MEAAAKWGSSHCIIFRLPEIGKSDRPTSSGTEALEGTGTLDAQEQVAFRLTLIVSPGSCTRQVSTLPLPYELALDHRNQRYM
jgi:hypothetical protein